MESSAHSAAGQRLRIVIVPAGFDPRLHYQENIFARTLHRMGHEVMVVTSVHGFRGEASEREALDAALPFRIVRARRVLAWKSTILPLDGSIGKAIRAFDPQVAFLLAPNHGLGAAWVHHFPASCHIIAGFSDLPWHRGGLSACIKQRWARKVIRSADRVITATRDTDTLVKQWGGPGCEAKIRNVGLTYEAESLEGGQLPPAAEALSKRVSRLIACVTRVSPDKQLDVLFAAVERFLTARPDAGFVMAGFGSDAESEKLRRQIAASPVADRCVTLPLLSGPEIGALFRSAACSVWSLVSIGIYHSLHCGCPVLVREGQDASHLLANPASGRWFASLERLDAALPELLDHPVDRSAVSRVVEPFLAPQVLQSLLDEARKKPAH